MEPLGVSAVGRGIPGLAHSGVAERLAYRHSANQRGAVASPRLTPASWGRGEGAQVHRALSAHFRARSGRDVGRRAGKCRRAEERGGAGRSGEGRGSGSRLTLASELSGAPFRVGGRGAEDPI